MFKEKLKYTVDLINDYKILKGVYVYHYDKEFKTHCIAYVVNDIVVATYSFSKIWECFFYLKGIEKTLNMISGEC